MAKYNSMNYVQTFTFYICSFLAKADSDNYAENNNVQNNFNLPPANLSYFCLWLVLILAFIKHIFYISFVFDFYSLLNWKKIHHFYHSNPILCLWVFCLCVSIGVKNNCKLLDVGTKFQASAKIVSALKP